MRRSESTTDPAAPLGLEVEGRMVALSLRRSPRARRIHLRIDPVAGGIELVLPRRVALAEGMAFARTQARWIDRRLAAMPARVAFGDGAVIPILGETVTIRHQPAARGTVRREGDLLHVAGGAEHLPRRLRDWLKKEAARELTTRAQRLAARIDRGVKSVRLRDPKTRWGSCSRQGGLAFSWRLILAPVEVVEYVVAHEVAHLVEFHHGPRFWRLVETLAGDCQAPRRWLTTHGPGLLRYG